MLTYKKRLAEVLFKAEMIGLAKNNPDWIAKGFRQASTASGQQLRFQGPLDLDKTHHQLVV